MASLEELNRISIEEGDLCIIDGKLKLSVGEREQTSRLNERRKPSQLDFERRRKVKGGEGKKMGVGFTPAMVFILLSVFGASWWQHQMANRSCRPHWRILGTSYWPSACGDLGLLQMPTIPTKWGPSHLSSQLSKKVGPNSTEQHKSNSIQSTV